MRGHACEDHESLETCLPRSTESAYIIHFGIETQTSCKCFAAQHEDTKSDPIVQHDAASVDLEGRKRGIGGMELYESGNSKSKHLAVEGRCSCL